MEKLKDSDGDIYTPCGNCYDGYVYHIGIHGSDDTYLDQTCGKCGTPLCDQCFSESTWTYDENQCCDKCCEELDYAQEQMKRKIGE